MKDTAAQSVLFPDLFSKPLQVHFSADSLSSDGGLLLLRARDRRMELTGCLAAALRETRQHAKIEHSREEQIRHRVYTLACGYRDVQQAAALGHDPLLNLCCDRPAADPEGLSSQPTLSRFENSVRRTELYRAGRRMAARILDNLARTHRRARRVWIDLDPTCTPTYGAQQLTFFNGYYDTYCYLPLVVTVSFDEDPRKYPVVVLLRGGTAPAMEGVLPMLSRLVPALRARFRHARMWVRADSAYGYAPLLDWLDAHGVDYDLGLGSNPVLVKAAAEAMDVVRDIAERQQETVTFYVETSYQAQHWARARRVLIKAEVVHAADKPLRDNLRFLVTTGTTTPKHGFARYYGHSDMENVLKQLKDDLALGRFSCSRAAANQWRALLTLAAFTLVQGLSPSWRVGGERPQIGTLRLWLLKVAVRVRETTRRIVIEVAEHHPWADRFRRAAMHLGAVPI
jgi:hypothetical protein